MIIESNCSKRGCIHYIGVYQADGTEQTECHSCKAFLTGIPISIAYGRNQHLTPLEDQLNDIVFEELKTK
jgi:hypothetical protein